MNEYMSDEELLKFIEDVENNDLVEAPLGIADNVFKRLDKKSKIAEYRQFRNRVIASVAAVIILATLLPEYSVRISAMQQHSVFEEHRSNDEMFRAFRDSHYISDFLRKEE